MAKLLGSGSAIGKVMEFNGNFGTIRMTVKGVIDDYVYGDMYGAPAPVVFMCAPNATNLLYVRIKPQADPEQALAKIEQVLKKVSPGNPFEYSFVDDQFNALFLSESLISKLSPIATLIPFWRNFLTATSSTMTALGSRRSSILPTVIFAGLPTRVAVSRPMLRRQMPSSLSAMPKCQISTAP